MPSGSRPILILAILFLTFLAALYFLNPPEDRTSSPNAEADRTAVLAAPGPDAAADYQSLVERIAEPSPTLAIGPNCAMTPLVLKLQKDASIKITNTDTIPHTVAFEDGGLFYLAPDYEKEIALASALSKTAGIHRYRCDDISKTENVGVVYIVE